MQTIERMTTTNNTGPTQDDIQQQLQNQAQKLEALAQENSQLKRQLAWFQKQLFGRKSEKRLLESPLQETLAGLFPDAPANPSATVTTVAAHHRSKKAFPGTPADSGLRFNEQEVPVKEIDVRVPELCGPNADQFEVIRYEYTYRLAQRRGSYEVLKYKRPILKHKDTQRLISSGAPEHVFAKSIADVSFVVGMLIDKFAYHLPLYRQHQRLKASYIEISRATLTHLVTKAAALLEPIAKAVLASILESALLAMDETPTKAGRKKKQDAKRGEMRPGWFWPLCGDREEVYFHFSPSRGAEVVKQLLSGFCGTLLSDGYTAYETYVKTTQKIVHALCWVHTRRYFEKALDDEPMLAHQALDMIGALYAHEEKIREKSLQGEEKQEYRACDSKPIVDKFFLWCTQLVDRPDLVATQSPIQDAVKYALKREQGLRVFLTDPEVPLDTNHVERTLRVIPCGRKNWNFSWNELGAHHVGIIQTLLCTCKLQGVDPYVYLVDVLQRVDRHPASRVQELTPRIWKEKFAQNPLRSDIEL